MFKKILVSTDGSALSQKAIDGAIELSALHGAELLVLKVVPLYSQTFFEGGLAAQAADVTRIEKQWTDEGQATVDAAQELATARGVKARGVITKSEMVSDAIIDMAKENDCDLIVMASHGRRGIKRLLLGSETQQVLTHAHIPVLILR